MNEDDKLLEDEQIKQEIAAVLNKHSRENASNTPNFILADVMWKALLAYEEASRRREQWYFKGLFVGSDVPSWLENPDE